jgi:hypothetical protein
MMILLSGCASNPLDDYDEYEMIENYREVHNV